MKKFYLLTLLFSAFQSYTVFAAGPANDDCTGAIDLQYNTPVTGTTVGATESMAAATCNGYAGDANDDVWYKFTALSPGSAVIKVTNVASTLDPVLVGYLGSCGSLNIAGCADGSVEGEDESLIIKNLSPGQTVYIRIYGFGSAGTEGTFSVTLTGSALPVTVRNFNCENKAGKNILYWNTVTEQNTKKFEVLYSSDGLKFKTIGEVASKAVNGNSDMPLSYSFIDNNNNAGVSYYKLKQVNADNESTYSNIVAINDKTVSMKAEIFPNPVKNGQINVHINSAATSGNVSFVITDMLGKNVLKQSLNINRGSSIVLNISSLKSGAYLIKAITDKGEIVLSTKFFKD